MRVVVTGGCGYIGSALLPSLVRDPAVDTVVIVDDLSTGSPRNLRHVDLESPAVAFRRGDVRNSEEVSDAIRGADTIVHLAAITGASSSVDQPDETDAVNLQGTKTVLEAAREHDVENLVFASSCNIYGRSDDRILDETSPVAPTNPYATAKYRAERELETYCERYGLSGTALRMSTNYGAAPGIRFNLVVNQFLFQALVGRPLSVYGDGTNWRPFIHVDDAARAYKHAALNPDAWSELVYNVGSNEENYRISTVAETVQEVLDRDIEIVYAEERDPGPSYRVDFDRVHNTGYRPNWSLREGIRDLATELRNVPPSRPKHVIEP